jgi:RimJ/RimL family protein N-acetyltransferase
LLEGKNVNLRAMRKEDVSFFSEALKWKLRGADAERQFDNPTPLAILTKRTRFVIEKKDETRIGLITHYLVLPSKRMEIGYNLIPSERGKGYGSEAVQIIVDHLFLTKDIVRIQAVTNVENVSSKRVLEKAGFVREGTLRGAGHTGQERGDAYIYSILRKEWKEPKILTQTS